MSEQPHAMFAQMLQSLMDARGLTQAALAKALNTYDGNVRRWRTGQGIEIENVWKLADYFGVDRNDLARLAGYPDSELSISSDRLITSEIDALVDAERAEMHAQLRDVPSLFHKAILTAQRAARRLAIDNARAAIELVSIPANGELAPPRRRRRHDDTPAEDGPREPLASSFAYAGAH